MSFDIDGFVCACRAVRHGPHPSDRIADLVKEAIADPAAIRAAVEQRRSGKRADEIAEIFVSDDDLTIYQVSFPANVFGVPHDHAGWAVIGIYDGVEAFNTYDEVEGALVLTGRREMRAPVVDILGPSLIHDIDNPGQTTSGSIHVYSNRHFDMPGRRIWRDGASRPDQFTVARSFEYGMERTALRRRELGLNEVSTLSIPNLEEVRNRPDRTL